MWLTLALLSAALYAIAEIIDNFLSNRKFKHPLTLVFFSSLFNLIFIPVLVVFQKPELPSLETIPLFILLGFVNIGYLYPYYKALKSEDTSVAISFLAIERVMVPILAFLIVNEVLEITQYVGIAIIVASVILLGLHHSRSRFKLSKGVWYITIASLFLAFEAILLKLLFMQGVSVSTAVAGESSIALLWGLGILLVPRVRRDIFGSFSLFVKISPLFLVEELFTFLGLYTEASAIEKTSVSIVKGVTMASPFFLILYAWIAGGLFPSAFKEDLHRKKVVRKLILFLVLIIGVILVND